MNAMEILQYAMYLKEKSEAEEAQWKFDEQMRKARK